MCEIPEELLEGEIFKSWEETLEEFREFADMYCFPSAIYARHNLKYDPPWISQELLDYSLYGVEAIKI